MEKSRAMKVEALLFEFRCWRKMAKGMLSAVFKFGVSRIERLK